MRPPPRSTLFPYTTLFRSSILPRLAGELVTLRPAVIVATGAQETKSLQAATRDIPIVFLQVGDPLSLRVVRSEEHTSELQSHVNLVCRLLLEKKNNNIKRN